MYYLQSRYYDPQLGRFVNADEPELVRVLCDKANMCNIFSYCANAQVGLADAMGLFPNLAKFFARLTMLLALFLLPILRLLYKKAFEQSQTVTVFEPKNCPTWHESSKSMGNRLKKALGALRVKVIKVDSSNFLREWKKLKSNYVIFHTHGSPECIAGEKNAVIFAVKDAKKMRRNTRVKLAVCTACSTAGSNGKMKNIAQVLSEKISQKGIMIANQYDVWGTDDNFYGAISGKKVNGWTVYRNGKVITTDIPEVLTLQLASEIYKELR